MITDETALHRKLRIGTDARVWVWPPADEVPVHEALGQPTGVHTAAEAHVAIVVVHDRAGLREALAEHLGSLAGVGVVWLLYAKGNRVDVNRDSLWVELAAHRWRAVSQVSFDTTRSALRIRPLRVGEAAPTT